MINKYIAAVLCGLFLLAGHLPAAQAEADFNISEAINKAGRQRMLTQRIVKSYLQMGQDVRYRVASKHLKESVALFELQLSQLKAFTKDPETQRGLELVEKLWIPVKTIATGPVEREQAQALRESAEKLLVAAHQVVLMLADQSGTNQGHLVNIAGRQRMLTQRMGNLYMMMSWKFEDESYKQDYKTATEEFEKALQELNNANENTQPIQAILTQVNQNWDMYKLSNRMGNDEYVPGLVARMLDKILEQMNDVTGLYAALP
ncbi:MAG: type IV pili methyl-accepting chemotaxis transducer N-terminal domain-containing protein [Sedimenticola sp.]|nr:type IV pili methyl-accepting chemotaxis transducer N-terminal domain-containing protein [Sedimenticola sp.]MCW8920007.1 type IV pili methyl-accepting chemotaxis transducer N-terminal domain-containing protein [Sedimenticola sp.]MCW8947503.1 type IV pili methyl-accepting chemotaxis transducer N-terminal domain-containing protein [Sedimenticola sp.]MCW8951003.1 type IV pili methyl-accepting chemotaxis transducer N-terminal domain-containing protein [Sedimenticola sp.]MCW8976067.1 type IV pili